MPSASVCTDCSRLHRLHRLQPSAPTATTLATTALDAQHVVDCGLLACNGLSLDVDL